MNEEVPFSVPVATVRALLRVAPTADARGYLNGVHLDPAGYAVATDGAVLLAVRIAPAARPPATVPVASLTLACKETPKGASVRVFSEYIETPVAPRVQAKRGADGAPWARVSYEDIGAARYPDWRRVLRPAAFSDNGKPAAYASALLERLRAALNILTGADRPILHVLPHGSDCAGVCYPVPDNAVALIMPSRPPHATFDAPAHLAQFLKPDILE